MELFAIAFYSVMVVGGVILVAELSQWFFGKN